jgi:hypothetical protein
MRADFVNEVARELKIERRDLIEKDLILHQMLADLSQDDFFAPNFLFKGGTCLIKCYFGYVRFSEALISHGRTRLHSINCQERKSDHNYRKSSTRLEAFSRTSRKREASISNA